MVERLHRQLKAALKAYSTPERWTTSLSMVLLGVHHSQGGLELHCSGASIPNSVADPGGFLRFLETSHASATE